MKKIILPEIVATGIYRSSVAVKNREVTKNRKTTMFELEMATEDGGVSFIDREQVSITQNTMICAKPGQMRHTRLPYQCHYVHIIVNEGLLFDLLNEIPNYFVTEQRELYVDLFNKIAALNETKLESDTVMMQGLLLQLIYMMRSEGSKIATQSKPRLSNRHLIEKAIAYIHEHISERLDLATLAEYLSLSPIHFHNTFKSSTGITLRKYVEEQRIKRAVDLLITTDYDLTRIAMECVFSSQSYFSFAFKRKLGKTPREYAREINERYNI